MTRNEHLAWCKQRALEYLERGDIANAVTSMLSDMQKHNETRFKPGTLDLLGMNAIMTDDLQAARRFIEGFR